MKVRRRGNEEEITLDMTSMIDIVFQLLIFFIMTFKIVAVEGDFNIKMPLAAPSPGMPDTPLPPLRVRLTATDDGSLGGINFQNSTALSSMDALRNQILKTSQQYGADMSEVEVELDVDYDLHYKHVIAAITAVTGYVDPNGKVQKLVEKVKFASPRKSKEG